MFNLVLINYADIDCLLDVTVSVFGDRYRDELLDVLISCDKQLSRVAVDKNGVVVGFSLVRLSSLWLTFKPHIEHITFDLPIKTIEHDYTEIGIEGLAVGCLPEYRGTGIGHILVNHIVNMSSDFNYHWGTQYEDLNSVNHWLKKRVKVGYIIENDKKVYITASPTKKK